MTAKRSNLPFRTLVQSTALLALHTNFAQWVGAMWVCNPVMSCHACPLAWFACPIGILSHLTFWGLFPLLTLGMLIVLGVLIGRLLCGWICPFGFLQDLLYRIPSKKGRLPRWADWIKYPLLLLTVFLLPGLFGVDYSFCTLCPTSFLQVTAPSFFTDQEFTVDPAFYLKAGVTLAVLLLAVRYSRFFCRVLCPIGALLALFNFLCFWRVKPPTESCISCGRCNRACPTDCRPAKRFLQEIPANRNMECVACHDCRPVCPVPDRPGKED